MKGSPSEIPGQINFISPDLIDQLNPNHELVVLANKIPWNVFEEEFSKLYSPKTGRPSKPVRRMTGLLILKQMESLSDERIVEAWVRDPLSVGISVRSVGPDAFSEANRGGGSGENFSGFNSRSRKKGIGEGNDHRYDRPGEEHNVSDGFQAPSQDRRTLPKNSEKREECNLFQ